MPKILFLHRGQHAASTRYRALQYFDCLRRAEWTPEECKVSGSFANYLAALQAAHRADVVVVLKKTFRPLYRWLLRRASKCLVFDCDDAVYVRDDGTENSRSLKQFKQMLTLCDGAWVGNNELLKAARPCGGDKCLIPTTVECEKYLVTGEKSENTVDLVWIGGSSSRPWLESILPILDQAALLIPNLRLKIVADFSLPSQHLDVIPIQWSEESEALELVSSHIGLAPLPDTAFTRGKCGLKSLQYMAAGLPVIASPVGVQTEIVQHGTTGMLANTKQDWLDSIVSLAADPKLRDDMGKAGRDHCRQNYSIQSGCSKMLQELECLITP